MMNGSTSVSPATYWLTWPLQFAELATQAFHGNGIQAAPDVLAQNINPWTININSNNSSAPGTEQRILARHSYGPPARALDGCRRPSSERPGSAQRLGLRQRARQGFPQPQGLSLIHISEPTRLLSISYAVFCL